MRRRVLYRKATPGKKHITEGRGSGARRRTPRTFFRRRPTAQLFLYIGWAGKPWGTDAHEAGVAEQADAVHSNVLPLGVGSTPSGILLFSPILRPGEVPVRQLP